MMPAAVHYEKPNFSQALEINRLRLGEYDHTASTLGDWIAELSSSLNGDRAIADGVHYIYTGDEKIGFLVCQLNIATFVYDDRKRVLGRFRYGKGLIKRGLITASYVYNNKSIGSKSKIADFYIDYRTNRPSDPILKDAAESIHTQLIDQLKAILHKSSRSLLIQVSGIY